MIKIHLKEKSVKSHCIVHAVQNKAAIIKEQ